MLSLPEDHGRVLLCGQQGGEPAGEPGQQRSAEQGRQEQARIGEELKRLRPRERLPPQGAAQDAGKVGLTMGYPSSVGVIWNVAGRVALRPEITLSRMSGDSSTNDLLGAAPVSTNDSTGAPFA